MRRPVSTPCRLKAAQIAVKGRFIGHSVLPTAPENPHPCATKGADRVGMVLPTRPCPPIDLAGPGMPVAGRVGERSDCVAKPLVAGAAETRHPALSRLHCDRAHPRIGRESGITGVALTGIAELGDQRRGADDCLRVSKKRREDRRVGMGAKRAPDSAR